MQISRLTKAIQQCLAVYSGDERKLAAKGIFTKRQALVGSLPRKLYKLLLTRNRLGSLSVCLLCYNNELTYLTTVGYSSTDHVYIESNEIATQNFPITPIAILRRGQSVKKKLLGS